MDDRELREVLIAEDVEQLRNYASHLLQPEPDKTLVLTAHLVAERLLGDMIATKLPSPNIWLDDADFRSRTNLARALGLIGNDELAVCRVLNSARNSIAHGLEPLPEKWVIEIQRLACRRAPGRGTAERTRRLDGALKELITQLAAPWLYVRFQTKRRTMKDLHAKRWKEIMVEKLAAYPDLQAVAGDDTLRDRLCRQVDLDLAKELAPKKKTEA